MLCVCVYAFLYKHEDYFHGRLCLPLATFMGNLHVPFLGPVSTLTSYLRLALCCRGVAQSFESLPSPFSAAFFTYYSVDSFTSFS